MFLLYQGIADIYRVIVGFCTFLGNKMFHCNKTFKAVANNDEMSKDLTGTTTPFYTDIWQHLVIVKLVRRHVCGESLKQNSFPPKYFLFVCKSIPRSRWIYRISSATCFLVLFLNDRHIYLMLSVASFRDLRIHLRWIVNCRSNLRNRKTRRRSSKNQNNLGILD